MTRAVYTQHYPGAPEPQLYLNRHGDLYQPPESRAELVRQLQFQRRLVAHLVDVIQYVTRGRKVR